MTIRAAASGAVTGLIARSRRVECDPTRGRIEALSRRSRAVCRALSPSILDGRAHQHLAPGAPDREIPTEDLSVTQAPTSERIARFGRWSTR
jgi:hypothetical protein